jgi:hypothetical protein
VSTFLELVQDVARKSGTVSGTQPASVTGQSGRLLKFVNWTADAWDDIQNKHQTWRWMRKSKSFALTMGLARYAAASFGITDFGRWADDNVRTRYFPHTIYQTSLGASDEGLIKQITYDLWRVRYGRGSGSLSTNYNRPVSYAISDANELCFGPIPDGTGWTWNGEYWQAAVRLAANGDIPGCPVRFHKTIVDRALMYVFEHDEAPLMRAQAEDRFKQGLFDLEADQLPRLGTAGTLR